ncbi:acyl-CoA thioesterase [Inmirania thermothiophila]|uniref:Acyl-CoA thioesterase FadM n=1 Tax=Inmirania thermothiophila TaxID=1750597 RepID=A0A3N1YAB7_9GAMM|nr:thioesterase family protein [Inmirania thermothiophila]ROR34572.1 acyl-CoA thioesterase FadM [Inmirania thermothiophila]
MSRVRIELPERFVFACELAVRIGDVNYGGHLGNDALVGLLHEARVRWLAARGRSELDLGGCGLVVADLAVAYRAEAFHGERLRIELGPDGWGRHGFSLAYRVGRPADGVEVARARTGLVCFDYRARRVAEVPPGLREALSAPVAA